jgi:hypothetical protein
MEIAMPYTQARYRQALLWYWLQQHRFKSSGNPLLTDLVAYWNLQETAGTRFDSTANSNNLTDNGSVGSSTGIVGDAANFDGTNTLSLASNSAVTLDGTTDFTIAGWFKTSSTATQTIVGKEIASSTASEYLLFVTSGTNLYWRVGNSSGTLIKSGLSTGSWNFFVAQYDTSTGDIGLSVNGGSFITTAATPFTITDAFYLGSRDNSSLFFNGLLDEVGIWKRLLTLLEITGLYNSGSGLTYPFV